MLLWVNMVTGLFLLAVVTVGIFGSGPRYVLVVAAIGMTVAAVRVAELAEKLIQSMVRKADERPEGR